MALNPHLATVARNRMVDQLNTDIGASGFLRVYDGTQPTNANTALGSQVMLAELALSATAFAAAASGSAAINTVTADASANATGTATWCTLTTSAGVRVFDGSCGLSASDFIIDNTSIVAGQNVACPSFSFSLPA